MHEANRSIGAKFKSEKVRRKNVEGSYWINNENILTKFITQGTQVDITKIRFSMIT